MQRGDDDYDPGLWGEDDDASDEPRGWVSFPATRGPTRKHEVPRQPRREAKRTSRPPKKKEAPRQPRREVRRAAKPADPRASQQEEARRRLVERRRREAERRIEEQRQEEVEELRRLAAEQRRREEQQEHRRAEQQRAAEAQARRAQQQRAAEEQQRAAEEQQRAAEEQRRALEEQRRQLAEQQRVLEEQRWQLAEQRRRTEQEQQRAAQQWREEQSVGRPSRRTDELPSYLDPDTAYLAATSRSQSIGLDSASESGLVGAPPVQRRGPGLLRTLARGAFALGAVACSVLVLVLCVSFVVGLSRGGSGGIDPWAAVAPEPEPTAAAAAPAPAKQTRRSAASGVSDGPRDGWLAGTDPDDPALATLARVAKTGRPLAGGTDETSGVVTSLVRQARAPSSAEIAQLASSGRLPSRADVARWTTSDGELPTPKQVAALVQAGHLSEDAYLARLAVGGHVPTKADLVRLASAGQLPEVEGTADDVWGDDVDLLADDDTLDVDLDWDEKPDEGWLADADPNDPAMQMLAELEAMERGGTPACREGELCDDEAALSWRDEGYVSDLLDQQQAAAALEGQRDDDGVADLFNVPGQDVGPDPEALAAVASLQTVLVRIEVEGIGVPVSIDGDLVGHAPAILDVAPGQHTVVVGEGDDASEFRVTADADPDAWCFETRRRGFKQVRCTQ